MNKGTTPTSVTLCKDSSACKRLWYTHMNIHSSTAKCSKVPRWRKMLIHTSLLGLVLWQAEETWWAKGYLNFPSGRSHLPLHFYFWKWLPYSLPFIPPTVTRRSCHLAHLSPATCCTVSQPGSLHPCGEGRWAEPHPLQRNGCTKECMNPMLPGACLIYSYKQHPSSHTVPFLPFTKHHSHTRLFIN